MFFSDYFGVTPARVQKYGAFDISLRSDLPLFIDPFLIFNSERADYQRLHKEIIRYVRFLREQVASGPVDPGLLRAWFHFPEVKQNWLGFSRVGNQGRGLGSDFAHSLVKNFQFLMPFAAGITRSIHLEKLCLLKDGIGRDFVSDFTTNLIKGFLLDFTQTFARKFIAPELTRELPVRKVRFNYATQSWADGKYLLPALDDTYVILTPLDILTRDETWINRHELIEGFDQIVAAVPNDQLRSLLNQHLLRNLGKEPTKDEVREARASAIEAHPEVLDYYIGQKEQDGDRAVSVSLEKVDYSRRVFNDNTRDLVGRLSKTPFYREPADTYESAMQRVLFLKDVIENKGGHRLFYDGAKFFRRESDLQILYKLAWFGTQHDVTREANDGRGPVDFKISNGAFNKCLAEFKLASNTQLKRNLKRQTPTYEKASDAPRSIKVITFFTDDQLRKVNGVLKSLGMEKDSSVVLIDARKNNKPSGSKA